VLPRSPVDSIGLTPEEFCNLRDLLAERTGLHFGPEARFTVERRLRERLSVLGLGSFLEYFQYLRSRAVPSDEWDEAIDILTTNETYFFREQAQLQAFEREVLPILRDRAKRRRRLALWSAGCATGEEAYTLAMIVHESGLFAPEADGDRRWDIRIYGTDISRRCVGIARRGAYGERSFRVTPREMRDKFFSQQSDGWHIAAFIRDMCHFGQESLLEERRSRLLGSVDAVFCRNVLIYFDLNARKTAIDAIYNRLQPGGALFLGHSESLLNVPTTFELLHLRDDLVYRKPEAPREEEPRSGSFKVTTPSSPPPIRLLVVDDSAYNRRSIAQAFVDHPEVEIVGKAADGEEALKLVTALKPDAITLDLEMPRMDGFTFLRILMARAPTPVVVVSSYSQRENVFKALEFGALDFVPKPDRPDADTSDLQREILQKVLLVRSLRPSFVPTSLVRRSTSGQFSPEGQPIRWSEEAPTRDRAYRFPSLVIAIASSTGGPSALMHIFGHLPTTTTAAFVVAQHMPDKFTRTFAERLDRRGPVRTVEASDWDPVSAGAGFVCPGRKCMEVTRRGDQLHMRVVPADPGDRYVPSADRLFKSVAVLGKRAVAVVLTGMGDDGVEGARAIRDAGGLVIAESHETAAVNGMPGAAVRAGVTNEVLPLPQISEYLANLVR
jgi:two-component system chemotaxis response regulator CheB